MKLSILVLAAVAEAAKKLHPPSVQIEKLNKHINTVWDSWFTSCKKDNQKKIYEKLVKDVGEKYKDCGYFNPTVPNGGPRPSRKRRDGDSTTDEDYDEDYFDEAEEEEKDPRLSANRERAIKQVGRLLSNFGKRYMAECASGLNAVKIHKRSIRRTRKLKCMSCGGGPGC